MTNILEFKALAAGRNDARTRKPSDDGSGEVIIFPGVRIDYGPLDETSNLPQGPSSAPRGARKRQDA